VKTGNFILNVRLQFRWVQVWPFTRDKGEGKHFAERTDNLTLILQHHQAAEIAKILHLVRRIKSRSPEGSILQRQDSSASNLQAKSRPEEQAKWTAKWSYTTEPIQQGAPKEHVVKHTLLVEGGTGKQTEIM